MNAKVKKSEMFVCRLSKRQRLMLNNLAKRDDKHPSDWFRAVVEAEYRKFQIELIREPKKGSAA